MGGIASIHEQAGNGNKGPRFSERIVLLCKEGRRPLSRNSRKGPLGIVIGKLVDVFNLDRENRREEQMTKTCRDR